MKQNGLKTEQAALQRKMPPAGTLWMPVSHPPGSSLAPETPPTPRGRNASLYHGAP